MRKYCIVVMCAAGGICKVCISSLLYCTCCAALHTWLIHAHVTCVHMYTYMHTSYIQVVTQHAFGDVLLRMTPEDALWPL